MDERLKLKSGVKAGTLLIAVLLITYVTISFAQRQRGDSPQVRPRRVAGSTPSVIQVRRGGNLQAALDAAAAGDTIILEAGATYVGPFTLPAKPASGDLWITIQSSASGQLPPAGSRVSPAHASLMPKLVSPGNNQPALRTAPYAHHYRLIGLEVAPASPDAKLRELIQLGDGSAAQNSLEQVPHHLSLERCYIHALPGQELIRGVALNSATTDILDCYVSDFKSKNFDAQAVWGWNGPGPFRVVNNYLEASGENFGFGGAVPGIPGLVPSDIEFRRNHSSKPLSWRGVWKVKNLIEFKSARRVVVDGNLFEHNWGPEQGGFAVVLTVRTEGCQAMQSTIEDVSFTNNTVRHAGGGINVLGRDDYPGCTSRRVRNVEVSNNLFEDVAKAWGGVGHFLQITDAENFRVAHNTILHEGNLIHTYGAPSAGFQYRDNLSHHGEYGIFGGGQSAGNASIRAYFPGGVISRNVIAGANTAVYPPNNFYPASLEEVRFVRRAARDYRLAANSPYKGRGAGGRDPGCDFESLNAALPAAGRVP
ncbi:MAG TPA: hypothetical protein VEY11_18330 [Pyrinomonadaceae bacterium]|nr:hypothetical protein [Pyrinomonadaceae bacterium]